MASSLHPMLSTSSVANNFNPLRTAGHRPKRIKLHAKAPPKGVEKHCLPLAPWGHFVGKDTLRMARYTISSKSNTSMGRRTAQHTHTHTHTHTHEMYPSVKSTCTCQRTNMPSTGSRMLLRSAVELAVFIGFCFFSGRKKTPTKRAQTCLPPPPNPFATRQGGQLVLFQPFVRTVRHSMFAKGLVEQRSF
jgi:hypothetical protein